MLLTIILICTVMSAMYVCVCNAVTESQIRDARALGARSLPELRDVTGVASCCGACEEIAHEILAEHGCATQNCACNQATA